MAKRQIVFFCATTPYVMIYKIAGEFKKRNYETVLITISQSDKWDINWYKDAFDKIICSNFQLSKPNPKNLFNMLRRLPYLLKAVYEMRRLSPYAVFGIARPNYVTALGLRFFKKYPFIYFPYDITAQQNIDLETALKRGKKKYEIAAERYCFENADGIMHKGAPEGLEFLKGRTMLGENLKITPLTINFQPYCTNEFTVPLNKFKLSKKGKEFHLVYVGGLYLDKKALKFYLKLFNKLIDQKIHIHIYTKTQHLSKEEDKKNLSPFIAPLLNSRYFHIDYAVDPRKLVSEISKYDFGMGVDFFEEMTTYLYPALATGNKTSSFLEAGLPFFYSTKCLFLDKFMKGYGLGLGINNLDELNDFNKKIKRLNYKKLEKNVEKAREDFNIEKHFPRLEGFVKQVADRKHPI